MRHLSIVIIFGALLVQSCDRFRENKAKKTEMVQPQEEIVYEEETIVPEVDTDDVTTKAAATKEVRKNKVTKKEPAELAMPFKDDYLDDYAYEDDLDPIIYEEEIIIQAQEPWPKNRGKTYNELQTSDDVDDYPFVPSGNRPNYNDRQSGYYLQRQGQ